MEGLVRLVAESLERHGMTVPPARIDWTAWTLLDSSLCLRAPCQPGLFVIAEPVLPHNVLPHNVPQNAAANSSAPLLILEVGETKDLGMEMARRCCHSPLHDRISAGRCFVRFAAIEDNAQRASVCASLQRRFTDTLCHSDAERSEGEESAFPATALATTDFDSDNLQNDDRVTTVVLARDLQTNDLAEPVLANSAHQPTRNHPAPLPSGF